MTMGLVPSGGSEGNFNAFLLASSVSQQSLVSLTLQAYYSNLCLPLHIAFLSVSFVPFSYKNTCQWIQGHSKWKKNLISRSITKPQWQKFLLQIRFLVEVPEERVFCCCLVAQSRLTLCSPTDCSLPGSSVRGIFQARILQWVAFSYSRRSS